MRIDHRSEILCSSSSFGAVGKLESVTATTVALVRSFFSSSFEAILFAIECVSGV